MSEIHEYWGRLNADGRPSSEDGWERCDADGGPWGVEDVSDSTEVGDVSPRTRSLLQATSGYEVKYPGERYGGVVPWPQNDKLDAPPQDEILASAHLWLGGEVAPC